MRQNLLPQQHLQHPFTVTPPDPTRLDRPRKRYRCSNHHYQYHGYLRDSPKLDYFSKNRFQTLLKILGVPGAPISMLKHIFFSLSLFRPTLPSPSPSRRFTGRVRQFWDEAAKSRHIVEAIPGFKQAIQADTIHVRSLAYQKVPRPVLAEICIISYLFHAINIEGLSLDKFLEHQEANCGWILEKSHGKGQLIVLPHNEFNHPKMKKNTVDSIPLEHITHIFPILG
ncbi:hypothetical protein ACOSP7_014632 [Xanthoceras sorbifolium]